MPPPPALTISPPAPDVLSLARTRFARLTDDHRRTREQLGLPTDRPIVMSGHQLAVWHPGILAKWLFTAAAGAPEHGLAPAWVWVDQDANAFGDLRYPVVSADTGILAARTWRITPAATGLLPLASAPPFEPSPLPAPNDHRFATPDIAPALSRIRGALAAGRAGAASAAEQMHRALLPLLAPLEPTPPRTFFATDLARTDLFASLVARLREDPRACTDAYNAAVAAYPGGHAADVAMLHTGVTHPRGPELPLWRISTAPGSPRLKVHAADLDAAPLHELAPRGLLMTGLLRLAACDVFIHGTGGGGPDGYDRITDRWFAHWLGETIAPTAVVTATLTLDLDRFVAGADPAAAAHARWLAHHARHHPGLLGDSAAEDRKRALVREIAALPRHDPRRAKLFREMHALLSAAAAAHADRLHELDRDADLAAARVRSLPVATDRTWPFPLYPEADLTALRSRVLAEVDEAAAPAL